MMLNGGKTYMNWFFQFKVKASAATASGSGTHETNGLN